MALPAALETLVGLIQDPVQREATRKELTDNHEKGLRQADYSRMVGDQKAQHEKNVAWHQRAEKQYNDMQDAARKNQERIAALEAAQRAGATGAEPLTPMEEDAVARELKQAREDSRLAAAKAADLESKLANVDKMIQDTLVTRERLITEGNALGDALLDVVDMQGEYLETYGKRLDRKALVEEAHKWGGDLRKAYDVLSQPERLAKLEKEIREKVEREVADKQRATGLPVEMGGGEPTLGPLQIRIQKKDTGIPDDIPADGTGRLSGLIAQELRAEGKT